MNLPNPTYHISPLLTVFQLRPGYTPTRTTYRKTWCLIGGEIEVCLWEEIEVVEGHSICYNSLRYEK